MLSKVASSTIFWVFGMTRSGIELMSSGPLLSLQIKQKQNSKDKTYHCHGLLSDLNKGGIIIYLSDSIYIYFSFPGNPVGWGCRIYRLHICREIRPLPTSVLDMTLHLLMGKLQIWSIPSLPLLPGPLWSGVAIPVRATSMDQTELLNHLLYSQPFNCLKTAND